MRRQKTASSALPIRTAGLTQVFTRTQCSQHITSELDPFAANKFNFAVGPQPTEHSFKGDLLPQWPGGVPPDEFDAVFAKISDGKVWSNPSACAKCAADRPGSALTMYQ